MFPSLAARTRPAALAASRRPAALVAALLAAAAMSGCRAGGAVPDAPARAATPSAAALAAIQQLDGLLTAGRLDDAAALAAEWTAREPGVADLELARALVTRRKSGHDAAIPAFQRVLALDPRHAAALFEFARGYVEGGQTGEAEPLLRRLLDIDPYHGGAAGMLGRILLARDEPAEALAVLKRAEGSGLAEVFGLIGRAHRALGDDADAERYLRRALDLDPRAPEPMLNLGQLLVRTGRTDEGEALLVEHSKLSAQADALDFVAQSSQVEGASAQNFMMLGETRRQQGDLTGAADAFRQAAAREPSNPRPLLGLVTVALQGRNYPDALTYAQQAVALDPALPLGQLLLGVALIRADQADAAATPLGTARRMSPWGIREWEMVGQAYYESGRVEDAVEAYQNGLAAAPNDDVLALRLGFLRYLQGDHAAARDVLAPAVARSPDDAELALALALTLSRLDDPGAEAMLEEAAARYVRSGEGTPATLSKAFEMFPESEAARARFVELAGGAP